MTPSTNSNYSKRIYKKSNKRPQNESQKLSKEELYRIECSERYDKMYHNSSKLLHREAKVVKSFECQKIVRTIKVSKDLKNSLESCEDPEKKEQITMLSKKIETSERKLERTKKLDLNMLVQVALKRLGVLNLDPKIGIETADNEVNSRVSDDTFENVHIPSTENAGIESKESKIEKNTEKKFFQNLIERMLQHKRLSTMLDQLNKNVIEFRTWTSHRQSVLNSKSVTECKQNKRKRHVDNIKERNNETMIVAGRSGFSGNLRNHKLDLGGHEGTSGLFIGSLSGVPVEAYSDDDAAEQDNYREYTDDYIHERKKSNRPGQRARKAKAMAIEARKAGRKWDSSINWREKKNNDIHHNTKNQRSRRGIVTSKRDEVQQDAKPISVKSQAIAEMGKTWKEEGNAHPSWAAAVALKNQNIVKFQGTKITFD